MNSFTKAWDKEDSFTGDAYDILDDKVRHFFNVCWKLNISPSQFHAVFDGALAKRAKTYFVHNMYGGRRMTFSEMYQELKDHFDTEVNCQQ